MRQSLDKAIRIGQLLTEQKDTLKHGEFTPWLEANIPFTDRTARNYMRLYRERDRIKTESVSDLTGAYALLTDHREEDDSCFDPDKWLEVIQGVNETFLRYARNVQIPTEPGSLYEHLNDGSMTDRERRGFSLWANFHCHLCYWTNFARVNGTEGLSPRLRRYLEVMWDGKPNWLRALQEPKKICGEHCGHGFYKTSRARVAPEERNPTACP